MDDRETQVNAVRGKLIPFFSSLCDEGHNPISIALAAVITGYTYLAEGLGYRQALDFLYLFLESGLKKEDSPPIQ